MEELESLVVVILLLVDKIVVVILLLVDKIVGLYVCRVTVVSAKLSPIKNK